MKSTIIIALLICIFYNGCDCNCNDEMKKVKSKYGSPEESNTYSSSDYKSVTWWYWSRGISFTFSWETKPFKDECCDKSTYTFTPIDKPTNANVKNEIINSLQLIDRRIIEKCDCILK